MAAQNDYEPFPVLKQGGDRRPLNALGCPDAVAWFLLAPHERQAVINHGQSLRTLADRGGLAPCEMVAVLEDRRWHRMDLDIAVERLRALCPPTVVNLSKGGE